MTNTIKQENKPRFRQSAIGLLNLDTFSKFLEKYPEYSSYTMEQFKTIVETYNGMLQQAVMDNRDGIELPEGLGNMFIGSCKPTTVKPNINRYKSIQVGQKVLNRNLATDGYVCKIFYSNYESKFKFQHRDLWRFKGVRQFTRTVSKVYREDWPKYIVIEEYMKIASLIRKQRKNEKIEKMKAINVANEKYNEFDLD
jgi:hypothetical protein